MKLCPKLVCALIGFATAAPATAEAPNAEARRQAQGCAAAAQSVEHMSAYTVVEFGPITHLTSSDPPPAARTAVQQWKALGASNLFSACPGLKARLPATVRAATPEDYAATRRTGPVQQIFITGFTAPFVSRDGKYLITSQVYFCPGLCGGRHTALQTRERSGWSKPQMIMMAIS